MGCMTLRLLLAVFSFGAPLLFVVDAFVARPSLGNHLSARGDKISSSNLFGSKKVLDDDDGTSKSTPIVKAHSNGGGRRRSSHEFDDGGGVLLQDGRNAFVSFVASAAIATAAMTGGTIISGSSPGLSFQPITPAYAAETTTLTTTASSSAKDEETKYDGFADYAKDNQMEKSDVGCFMDKCGDQTKALFSNPRGIKGVTCLGRCKGEQSCATRCFAQFGSPDLDSWLSCTIEENECVKVPKALDNSAETIGYSTTVKKFDPSTLVGTWYKTDGLNPNYDLFDCQSNTFTAATKDSSELDMEINLRISRPEGGYWDNTLMEHMVVDAVRPNEDNPLERTMHTEGKMYGLKFNENWFIIGESDGSKGVPPFKLVAYKGHTLQGNYEGSFVYSKEPVLPKAAVPAVRDAAAKAGLDFDKYTRIDNTCPTDTKPLNDATAGTDGTSTTEWVNLVVGEGGVIDWIVPGWRGEYKAS